MTYGKTEEEVYSHGYHQLPLSQINGIMPEAKQFIREHQVDIQTNYAKLLLQLQPIITLDDETKRDLTFDLEEFFYGNIFMKAELNEKRIEIYERKLSNFSYYAVKSTLNHFTNNPKEDPSLHNMIAIAQSHQESAISLLADINFIMTS